MHQQECGKQFPLSFLRNQNVGFLSACDGSELDLPLFKGKKGGIVLVAGDYGKFDPALRVMRAFFIWAGMEIMFELKYQTKNMNYGEAKLDNNILKEAFNCGLGLVD